MSSKTITLQDHRQLIESYIRRFNLYQIDLPAFLTKIESGITEHMSSKEIALFASECAASMITHNEHYGKLASVILISYHNSVTLNSFSEKIIRINMETSIINPEMYSLVIKHRDAYDSMIDYSRDYNFSYFAICSFMRSYMIKIDEECVERIQDVFMRTAIQIHRDDLENVKKTYDLISLGYYTQATPTYFNSMLKNFQLASCFLLTAKEDSIEGIFETISDCAIISKYSGGLGLNLHNVRSKGSLLHSTAGKSKGIIPIIKIINETMKYVNLGGIKRQSTIAFYLEPWHKDIFDFLDVRKNTGNEELRAREIFTALWVNDLFMERVEKNENWSLFDPKEVKDLPDLYGKSFEDQYTKYEASVSRTVVPARHLFRAIINAQIETGTPYMVYKDTCNKLSNQKNLGTIRCSNLCAEIIEYSAKDEIAVCNLASVCLPKYVENGKFNYSLLKEVTKKICFNLNRLIDYGFYPLEEAKRSNYKHRPIGIGVQGLADAFAKMRVCFDSEDAKNINKCIFETMYYGAIEASVELASIYGPYESYQGSPLSQGIFHFEMFGAKTSGMWDWEELRANLLRFGVRNSLFIALMPTAGTCQLFGNSECFEPFTSNIFTRRTVAGEFQIINSYLMEDLVNLGLWNDEIRHILMEHEGSVQNIPCIPQEIKDLYKTVWEIKMKTVLDMAADRQAFIDQSQSLNIYLARPTFGQLSSMHFYGWRIKLKTGMYYLRTMPISRAIKFTVDQHVVERSLESMQFLNSTDEKQENNGNETACMSCSC